MASPFHKAEALVDTPVYEFPQIEIVRFYLKKGEILDLAVMFSEGWDYVEMKDQDSFYSGYVESYKLKPIEGTEEHEHDSGSGESRESDIGGTGTDSTGADKADTSGMETA